MNVFNKVTLQGLKKNRVRSIVTIIGVILSAAMITAVTTFISSFQNYMIQNVIATDGDFHLEFLEVDSEFIQKRTSDKEVKDSAITQNVGYSILNGSKNDYKPYLFVRAFSDEAFDRIPINLLSGRLPENDSELVLSEHVGTDGGVAYEIGDTLTLELGSRMLESEGLDQSERSYAVEEVGSRMLESEKLGQYIPYCYDEEEGIVKEKFLVETTKTYTVVGICKRPGFEDYSAPGYSVITKLEDSNIDKAGSFNVFIRLKRPREVYDYSKKIAEGYSVKLNKDLLRFSGISDHDNFNRVLYSLSSILIALIMIGSILLIHNSFSISVSERTRQFGILSSVGATRKQLRKSVLFEGICIGIIGIPLGVLAGVGGIGVTMALVSGIFEGMSTNDVPLSLSISPISIVAAGIIGIGTILISAYIPAMKASGLSAIDAIRQTTDIKIKAKAVKTSKLTQKLFGLEGVLALKNFKRNKKRYRSTVVSLFVSIVLFVSASAFGMYLKQGTDTSIADMGYDISFMSYQMESEEVIRLYEKLKKVGGIYNSVYHTSYIYNSKVPGNILSDRYLEYNNEMEIQTEEELSLTINFIDDDAYLSYIKELGLDREEYSGVNAKLVATSRMQGYDPDDKRFLSFDMFKDKRSMSLGITPMEAQEGEVKEKNVTVTFTEKMPQMFSEDNYSGFMAYAPYSLKPRFDYPREESEWNTLMFMSKNPFQSVEEMKAILNDAGVRSGYSLYNVAELQEQNRKLLLLVNVFTYGFVILISLITIANVFNTISTNINLRRREFAMLKSVGLTDGGFHKMMNYECICYGVKALIFGLPTAIIITWFIYKGVMSGVDVPFALPWLSIGISVFSVFFVVFVTMLYSIGKVKNENTVDALKSDIL